MKPAPSSSAATVLNLAALAVIGLYGFCLIFFQVPKDNLPLLNTIVGGLLGVLVGAANAPVIHGALNAALHPDASPPAPPPDPSK